MTSIHDLESLPKSIKDLCLFEDSIWEIPKKPLIFNKVKDMISSYPKDYTQLLIQKVASRNIFGYKQLADIFQLTLPPLIKFDKTEPFSCYLYARKMIKAEDFISPGPPLKNGLFHPVSYFEEPVKPNTLWYHIWKNDVAKVQQFFEQKDKGPEYFFFFQLMWSSELFFYPTTFAAYCDSSDVLHYFSRNRVPPTITELEYAVKGGSFATLSLIMRDHPNLWSQTGNDMLPLAIQFHHRDIATLFYDRTRISSPLPICVKNFNTSLFLYFLHNKQCNINDCFQPNENSFTITKNITMNTILHEYIVSLGGSEPKNDFDLDQIFAGFAPNDYGYDEEEDEEEEVEEESFQLLDEHSPNPNYPHEGELY